MENNHLFNLGTNSNPLDSFITNGVSLQACNHPLNLNFRNGIMSEYSLQEEPNNFGLMENDFHDHFAEGTPISASALAALLSSRNCLQENLINFPISSSSVYPSQVLANSSFDHVLNDPTCRWDFDRFYNLPELSGGNPERPVFEPFRSNGDLDHNNGWVTTNNMNFSNELSLSLATTTRRSAIYTAGITEQCSDMSSSAVTHHRDQTTSSNSRELSLSFGSYKPAHFSQVISKSRYLHVVQDILAEILGRSMENLDQRNYCGNKGISMDASDEITNEDRDEILIDQSVWQRRDVESKKSQLLSLLQVVDDRYNQCMDEIHTVISAFHAATELNPQMHARFALHTMSFLYKNLRERISNQILAMGNTANNDKNGGTKEKDEASFDTSFIQKQWALQQLRRKEHQLWRPQRGLPERSVSVLRAWMFQNFLHPYPKDAEKHLLSVKSGLTRSQVSNWFINARVRLWKPMIEEMYSEMNLRNARNNDEGAESNGRSGKVNSENQRFKHN